uniref:Variant surface glycoprotein 1125.266 n=1 Tax=Trypanosoma brucei TaxID=5691 RepID=A0A1J0R5L8_9TRYP|nr:variant surface glycoprotein 1125.266 [Trypanosoma brucei]
MEPTIAVATLLAASLTGRAQAAKGDAQADFLAACNVWQTAIELAKTDFTPPEITSTLNDILNLNMTLAEDSWKANFKNQGQDNTFAAFKRANEAALGGTDWTEHWPKWKTAFFQTTDKDSAWKLNHDRKAYKPVPALIRKTVAAAADRAFLTAQELQRPITLAGQPPKQAITAAINAALCSSPLATLDTGPGCQADSIESAKSAVCSDGNDDKAGQSLGLDIICLCTSATDSGCVATASKAAANSNNIQAGVLQELLGKCPKPTEEQQSAPEHLSHALSAFIARIGTGIKPDADGDAFLGSTKGTDCKNVNAGCVNYKHYYKQGSRGAEDIPWVKQLRTAIKLAKQAIQEVQERHDKAARLDDLRHSILTEFERQLPDRNSAAATPAATLTKEADPAAGCTNLKTNTTCTAHKTCKWEGKNETDGKCVVDETKVTQKSNSARTGETANTEGKKCSEKKTKGNCKDGCKWENNACKDSSFLVHKKLALSLATFFGFAFF